MEILKIIKKGIMPNGTHIQIEDWSEDYAFHNYADTLASYPISKETHRGTWAPKAGERYRFSFHFKNAEETEKAYNDLLEDKKELEDYKHIMSSKLEYKDCI